MRIRTPSNQGSILKMYVHTYVSVMLRNVAVTSRRNVANQRSSIITRNRSLSNIGRASETALFRRQFHQLHDILVLTMKQMSYYAVCTFESGVARHIELAQ